MAWVQIDDGFSQHPKVVKAGPLAMAMQIAALCYSNRNLTDGFIPWPVAQTLLSWEFLDPTEEEKGQKKYKIAVTCGMTGDDVKPDFVIGLLLDAGIWEVVDGGYMIHDYKDYQLSKQQVIQRRESAKERMHQIRSPEVRANIVRTSQEITEKFNAPTPLPIPLPNPNSLSKSKKEKSGAKAPFVLPEWVNKELWDGFLEMRKKAKASPTRHALDLLIRDLEKLKAEGNDPGDVLEQSIKNSWKGLFAIKNGGSDGKYGKSRTNLTPYKDKPRTIYTLPEGPIVLGR